MLGFPHREALIHYPADSDSPSYRRTRIHHHRFRTTNGVPGRSSSMSAHSLDSGAAPADSGFYLKSTSGNPQERPCESPVSTSLDFLLESAISGPALLVKIPDLIQITASTFENGARRTEPVELKKAGEGKWTAAAAYRL